MLPICETPCSKLTTELSPELFESIGRVVVTYAAIEQEVKHIIFTILQLSTDEGRLIISEPDTSKSINNIKHLIKTRNLKVTEDITEISKGVKELVEIRNWLAHGVWTNIDGSLCLQIITGEWPAPGQAKKINRKIIPSVHPVTSEQLLELAQAGVELYESILNLHKEIQEQQKSLPQKQRLQANQPHIHSGARIQSCRKKPHNQHLSFLELGSWY